MNRFFVDPLNVSDNIIVIDSKNDIGHIKRVLRMKIGDRIEVSDGCSNEYMCVIKNISDNSIETEIIEKWQSERETILDITLFQGIPKQGKMDFIVQKCVELGVSRIVPVFMDRTVVSDIEKYKKKVVRYNTIAHEAAKQSKRGILPEVEMPCRFNEILTKLQEFDMVIFPYENEENRTIKYQLESFNGIPKKICIIIGPEGGFSDKEASELKNCGYESVSLGKTVLRTETAGVATVSMVMYHYIL